MEEILSKIKIYAEVIGAVILVIVALVLLFKMLHKKIDKNGNGKIEPEEITDADIKFAKEILIESIKTIALGMHNIGVPDKDIFGMILDQAKKSKILIEETIKESKNNENEKNSPQN